MCTLHMLTVICVVHVPVLIQSMPNDANYFFIGNKNRCTILI